MARKMPSGVEAVALIRRLLADWLRTSAESRQPVAQILDLLEPVERDLRAARPRAQRTRSTVEYQVRGDVLVEARAGGKSPPYQCPKQVYDAVAAAMVGVKTATDFEDLLELARQTAGVPVGAFHLRVLLRFWLQSAPPLLSRIRSRYRPLSAGTFVRDAQKAWEVIAHNVANS